MLPQYFDLDLSGAVTVKEGDTLSLGRHELSFLMAPMVHWPEVMVAYDSCDKVLFSADAFGKFGALDAEEDWACEARRYYFNIVGKYGPQVQALLKKAAALDIRAICPLHGPVLKEDLGYYLGKYDLWSSYGVEQEGVFIAYASLHGNTAGAATHLAELLRGKGCPSVAVADLARADLSEALEDAFKYGKVVLGGVLVQRRGHALYGGFPPPLESEELSKTHRGPDRKRLLGALGRADDERAPRPDERDPAGRAHPHPPRRGKAGRPGGAGGAGGHAAALIARFAAGPCPPDRALFCIPGPVRAANGRGNCRF